MGQDKGGVVGYLVDLSAPHPVIGTIGLFVVGAIVGAGGAWAYSAGAASSTRIVVTASVTAAVVGIFGGMMAWVAHRQYLRSRCSTTE